MGLLSAVVFIFSFAHIVFGQVRTVDYGGNQLLFYQERKTFDQARLACQKDNNDLVIVRDAKLQAFITPYLNSSINKSLWRGPWAVGYWIGGYRPAASTTWYWWDRTILASQPPSPIEYNNWVGIEPNGKPAVKMCVAMTPYPSIDGYTNIKGGWVDDVCYDLKYYICMKDICAPNPCFNGGTCIKGVGEYQCNCKPGYIGSKCDVTDQCTTAPCNNGGTCSMVGHNYTCSCVFGFTGTNCEKDSCSSSPCQNGGTCTKLPNHYICSCLDGFDGYNCDKAVRRMYFLRFYNPPQYSLNFLRMSQRT
ncbi:E-selectin-like [Ciona intestinalis]